jgi:prophage regulatory protein
MTHNQLDHAPCAILRKPQVMALTGLSSVTIWRLERAGDFPKRIKLTGRAVGWKAADISAWIDARIVEAC